MNNIDVKGGIVYQRFSDIEIFKLDYVSIYDVNITEDIPFFYLKNIGSLEMNSIELSKNIFEDNFAKLR